MIKLRYLFFFLSVRKDKSPKGIKWTAVPFPCIYALHFIKFLIFYVNFDLSRASKPVPAYPVSKIFTDISNTSKSLFKAPMGLSKASEGIWKAFEDLSKAQRAYPRLMRAYPTPLRTHPKPLRACSGPLRAYPMPLGAYPRLLRVYPIGGMDKGM